MKEDKDIKISKKINMSGYYEHENIEDDIDESELYYIYKLSLDEIPKE